MQSLEDIPTLFAAAWGIDVISAQIIMSVFIIFAAVAPILVLRFMGKKDSGFNIELVTGFMAMLLCVGLGWLHVWVLIAAILVIAIAAAVFGTDVIIGT